MTLRSQNKQPIVFCDFDGTITIKDNIVAIMRHFDPPGWADTVDDIISKRRSIRDGVTALFASLPASRKEEIIRYSVDNAEIRPGFRELLDACRKLNIPFYVVSGGIDFFIRPLLAQFPIAPEHVYCNEGHFDSEYIRIEWPHACDEHCSNDCGTCKPRIMRQFAPQHYYRIVIGDSITDFEAAKAADYVFARSHLLEQCKTNGIPYEAFEDFHSVAQSLQQLHTRLLQEGASIRKTEES
ncbi:2-hydroxy-3-keto-5-methylthiopentenyl-1-phosphate phosphatase [Xylanibacillus composti]|uniref:2-hydroxy-3-keto-5-methylthiopentenyl-1-phosphate phosphatase n=1 Tax=Xylanibacillus composti TaxID=1572762 RepID=A0A8J4H110_9BACL|nr:2-hydroxy-3-keto-5-methylthiopentenyl-1-phosphate phosphatase [Xylanibacillus composti]MDT9725512.1 2-hydroxy-3-keto-5-methylthiopentenyl-1-phosphate phosphatase [Xylanibacillus composti]GIQ67606.1 2-hydroxy-3-keto-5-methylthiopentenyl-1-phosphate phosphatase [Xylanibacillus composti]